jgi:type I restriction enzyme, S subunit
VSNYENEDNRQAGRREREGAANHPGADMKKGWRRMTLGDICSFENGDRGENYPSKSIQTASGVPFINAGHLTESGIDFSSMNYIPRERFDLLGNGKIQRDDILFCLRGSLGKCASVGDLGEGAIASSLVIVRPSGAILNEFVLAYLHSDICSEMIREFRNGAAQPNLSAASLKKFGIPLPPLPEQRRIVGILNEAFEGIATAKANAEKNLHNARELFESHLQAVFTNRGKGWVERRLGDYVQGISTGPFGSLLHKSDYEHSGIPLVNPINIEGDRIIPDDRKAVGKATAQRLARYTLRENDIVIGRRGEIGRCAVIGPDQAGWLCGTGCFIIRPSDETDPYFLTHLFRSQHYREQLEGVSERATMPSICNDDLANLVIALPSVPHQRHILKLLDALRKDTQRLEGIYQQKLATLDELKKSLLHQAFNGRL